MFSQYVIKIIQGENERIRLGRIATSIWTVNALLRNIYLHVLLDNIIYSTRSSFFISLHPLWPLHSNFKKVYEEQLHFAKLKTPKEILISLENEEMSKPCLFHIYTHLLDKYMVRNKEKIRRNRFRWSYIQHFLRRIATFQV